MGRILSFAFCCWLLAAGTLHASAPGVERYRLRHHGTAQGLSQASVRDLLRDRQGYLWAATQDGLNRFDGRRFRVFKSDRNDAESLSDNHVTALAEDLEGFLWVGTQSGGLNRFDPATERFRRFRAEDGASALTSNSIARILVGPDGSVWINSLGGELARFPRAGTVAGAAPFENPAADEPILVLTFLDDGRLLFATGARMWTWAAGESSAKEFASLPDADFAIATLAVQESDLSIWVGSRGHGIFHFDAGGAMQGHYAADADGRGPVSNDVRDLLIDRQGSLWAATYDGVSILRKGEQTFSHLLYRPGDELGLPGSRAVSLHEDEEGLIWVGTWTGGFSVYDPAMDAFTLVRHVRHPSALPGSAMAALAVRPDGRVWVSPYDVGGIYLFDFELGAVRGVAGNDPRLPHRQIGTMAWTPDGQLMMGTLGGGLALMDAEGETVTAVPIIYEDGSSPRDPWVQDVHYDRAGNLWVSMLREGLAMRCLDCQQFRAYRHDPSDPRSLASNDLNLARDTRDGRVWIGTRGSGLTILDPSTGFAQNHRFDPADPESISNDAVTDIHEDQKGRIWVGTQGGGLNRVFGRAGEPLTFAAHDSSTGLATDAIGAIVEDPSGLLWLSTTAGVSSMDPETGRIRNFWVLDGERGMDFFVGSRGMGPDGSIYFGGLRGLMRVMPQSVRFDDLSPEVRLGDLLVFNERLSPGARPGFPRMPEFLETLRIDHKADIISVEFAARNLRPARDLRYRYRLTPRDEDWVFTDDRRPVATYTGLAAGRYTLEVAARRDAGSPFGPVRALTIEIQPAPWRTPQAIAGYLLMLVLVAWMLGLRLRSNLRRRKAGQEAMRRSEERLKLALWGSRDELWDIDLRTGEVRRENQLPHLAVSQPGVEPTIRGMQQLLHPEDREVLSQAVADHTQGLTPFLEASYRTLDVDGNYRWLLSRGRTVAYDAQGKALRVAGTSADITEIKAQEEALRKLNEELESRVQQRTRDLQTSNDNLKQTLDQLKQAQQQLVESEKMAALGGLVAGIAHEINTPLGISVTAASHLEGETRKLRAQVEQGMLRRSDLSAFQESALQSTQLILRNLRRADQLIKSFKQVAVDQSSEQRRVIALRSYLEEILTSLHPTIKRSGHRVEIDCPDSLSMDTYPGAIYQIIVNLVMNSVTHAYEPDQTGVLRIEARSGDDLVELRYSDDGRGIPAEIRGRIFDPFFTTKRGQGGSGLGLHIVYNLITQLLRGSIDCQSAPGQGAVFTIVLPRVAAAPGATRAS